MADNTGKPATKGQRFLGGIVDLIVIFVASFLVNQFISSVLSYFVVILMVVGRDCVYSLGRQLAKTKLVSLDGEKVTFLQAVIRNLLLIFPYIMIIGVIIEVIYLATKGERILDGTAKTRVVHI